MAEVDFALDAQRLTASVGAKDLGPFSFRVGIAETVALVGTNGSGKTTAIKLALGLRRARDGSVTVFGRPVSPLRPPEGVGFVPDQPTFYDWADARTNLVPFAAKSADIESALVDVGLDHTGRKHVGRFSRGMRQRLAIARAVVGLPRLLVLDEPTIALDKEGVELLTNLLIRERRSGVSLLVATHDAGFLDRLDARAIKVDGGRTI
jgi:ABC-type multidrug transport system ATPase subunit